MNAARRTRLWLIVLVTATAALVAGTLITVLGGGDGRPVVTVHVDGPDADQTRDDTLTVPERAVERVERNEAGDHAGLRVQPQPVVAPRGPPVPETTTLASPEQDGCRTSLVRNWSSRNGASPRLFVLHFTVSPNRPGRSDVDGITAYFNNPASQASSTYVIDAEGNCNLIVPETGKAWTQGAFNPVSISVEQINTGSESSYAGTAGLAKLAQVVSDSTARWRIPLQVGATSGCAVTRAGVVDHNSLGCGNNHTDIQPFATAQVVAAAITYRNRTSSPLTAGERKLVRYSCQPKGSGHSAGYWRRRARARAQTIRQAARRSGGYGRRNRGTRRRLLARASVGRGC